MSNKEIAALPFRVCKDEVELVLVKTRHGRRWILPKGQPEKNMTRGEVAKLEAYEEAGVVGRIDEDVYEDVTVGHGKRKRRVRVYPLQNIRLLDDWPESQQRERVVVDAKQAVELLSDRRMQKCVKSLLRRVARFSRLPSI